MADYVGGRRSVVNSGTKLWRPPAEVTQLWRLRIGFGARFRFLYNQKKKFISMKPNSNLNHFQQLLFHTIPRLLINIIFFWSYKKRSSGAKTGLIRRASVFQQVISVSHQTPKSNTSSFTPITPL